MTCQNCEKEPTVGAQFYGSNEQRLCSPCAVVMLMGVIDNYTVVQTDGGAELVNDDVPNVRRLETTKEARPQKYRTDALTAMKLMTSIIDTMEHAQANAAIVRVQDILAQNQNGGDGSFTEETWAAMRRALDALGVAEQQTCNAYKELQKIGDKL